ncbi:DUF2478 domain-containing protein [Paracoccaceae bacterium Fryx2]|nr:DUF2478 domain-containing protein [Paracoccaceae bacterium Fryx2]
MRIGYVCQTDRGATDRLLSEVAALLKAEGVVLAGAVQVNSGCADEPRCDMDLVVLPDGPVIRISQYLGADSQGCRLDAGALEQAVGLAMARLTGAGLLVVNKFGKHESEGRGFRDLIAGALGQGIPVLVGVNPRSLAAFRAFAGDLAEPLLAEPEALCLWCRAAQGEMAAG